jgi:transporter family-2 protein
LGVAAAAGVAAGVQGVVNGRLGQEIGGLQAAFVSFAGGTLLGAIIVVASGGAGRLADLPVSQPALLSGGALGLFLVGGLIYAVPEIGLTASLVAVISGQLLAAVVIDRVGLLGLPTFPITIHRVVGVVLCFAGALLVIRR